MFKVSAMKCTMYPSVRAYGEDCYHHLALHLARHPASLSCWLSECKEILEKKCRHAPHLLIGLLCSILVRTDDEVCINLCLENLAAVAELDTSLVSGSSCAAFPQILNTCKRIYFEHMT